MATQATSSSPSSTSSSSSSSCPRWKYDVFLSFCSVDTRMNFTDHLYTALKQKSIITFRDDEKLERGKYISPELLKAIEESKYTIIVLSTNYASSRWCLIELAKIVECMKKTRFTVLPVFYHVDPSDVRNRRGTLAEAFAKHEKDTKVNTKDVQAWKAALRDVGHIAGWHVHDRYESKVIQEIIGRICTELYHKFSSVCEDLVGMDSRVEEMLGSYLGEGLGDVHFVGICGMGGMGKTTLAQEIYRRISGNFEVGKFIANVREETKNQGLVSLQKQLLSKTLMESEINISNVYEGINVIRNTLCNKKVFIVLDDVDGEEQLEALAGKHDWFGAGSRIILTSRDSHFLQRNEVDGVYKIKGLNDYEALKLFSWSAFKKPHPKENYVDLCKYFVNYAKGLPLALKVVGSLLYAKGRNEWKSALDRLKEEPNRTILDILQISFDGLTNSEKGLFLDIACFFKGEKKDCISDILESFGYYPDYNIGVLKDKSLITIDDYGILWMHDLLQDMGQEIIRRESPREPGRRSRLWIYKDVIHVLKNNIGTEAVEGIMIKVPIQKMQHLHVETFSKMKNLRFLKIGDEKFPQDFINGTMQLPKSLNYLSDKLRIIEWLGYPFKSMPTSFQPNRLVELRMRCSYIKQLWKGIMNLDELRLIDLSDSQNLIEMPDLSGAPKLKQLILQRCIRLSKIHASLGNLKCLIRLDLNGCKSLESLTPKISLEALEILDLVGCSRLKKFPEIVGNMPRLSELCLSGSAIKDLSISTKYLTGFIKLDLRDCKNLSSLSNACCCSMSLKILTLSGCSKLNELPEDLGNIKGLKVLSLDGCKGLSSTSSNKLISFLLMKKRRVDPTGMLERSLSNLWSLTKLNLSYCNLQAIPNGLGCLSSLIELDLRGNNFVCLPESTARLSNMKVLFLNGCTHLRSLPKLPFDVRLIYADGCTSLEILPLRPEDGPHPFLFLLNCGKFFNNEDNGDVLLKSLRHHTQFKGDGDIYRIIIPRREIPKWFRHQSVGTSVNLQVPPNKLWSLTKLNLSYCNLQAIPNGLGCLASLTELDLRGNNFVCLPESTTRLSNMKFLFLNGCTHLRSLPKLPFDVRLIYADGCTTLEILPLRPKNGLSLALRLLNCVKLINNEDYNEMLLIALRHHIQFKGDEPISNIIIPGREIPKWFRHQSVGTSVNLQVPLDKLKGVAVCALFVLRQQHPRYLLHELHCYLKANGDESHMFCIFVWEIYGKIESYHLYLGYYPYKSFNQKLKSQVDANGLGQIEIAFKTDGPRLEVTKCGARLIFEQEIEDLNQTMRGCSSSSRCSITPYKDDLEDSAKYTKTE